MTGETRLDMARNLSISACMSEWAAVNISGGIRRVGSRRSWTDTSDVPPIEGRPATARFLGTPILHHVTTAVCPLYV